MDHSFTHESENIILRPLSSEDSESYRQLRNRDEVRKWFLHSDIVSPEAQVIWYKKYLEKDDDCMFSVYYKEPDGSSVFIGGVDICGIDRELSEGEFGRIIIARDHTRKKGLGVEALKDVCIIAGRDLGLDSLYLKVIDDNIAALKTYERAGFERIEPPYPGERSDIEDRLIYMRRKVSC